MLLRKPLIVALFLMISAGLSGTARAEPKFWGLLWWPSHWENQYYQPYLEKPPTSQNTQWDEKKVGDDKKWQPADWSSQSMGGSEQIIRNFYSARILSNQTVEDNIPILEVGPNFYHLSDYDKCRVMRVVDDHYKITRDHQNAMFTLTDWYTKKPIGLYTASGLQLQ